MTRIVIGAALSTALLATAACSGSSPSAPSASPSATTFSAQTKSTSSTVSGSGGVQSTALSTHDHEDNDGHGNISGDNNGRGHEDQLEGVIASIDAAHTSFMVRNITVTVAGTTVIRHGHTTLLFADLKVGDQVHVKGTQTGTTLAASEVNVQNDGEHDDNRAEAEGVVAGLTGTCPSITFTVGATHVATDATTTFGRSACADVVNGAAVEVTGVRQTDGSILASRVSVEGADD